MRRASAAIASLAVLIVAPFAFGGASAADVSKTVVAGDDFHWHDGSATGATDPAFTVNAGDTLRLTVVGDSSAHTFTVPHFGINRNLAIGETIFVNITTTAADVGSWQYVCTLHSNQSGNAWTGMVGSIVVVGSTTPPPRTPGFESLGAIGALGAAFLVVAAVRSRQK